MTSLRPKRTAAAVMVAAGAAAVIVAAVVAASTGCASDCASNCPPATVYIGNLDNQQLQIDDILVDGPACPPQYGVYCVGDDPTTNCTHFTITGHAQGICDVLIVFSDRPAMIVRTEFGPPIQQGCCKGHSIVGDSIFVIPASADAGISGVDGASDAVTIVVDAGASDAGGGGN
jgi:hypothetical protein